MGSGAGPPELLPRILKWKCVTVELLDEIRIEATVFLSTPRDQEAEHHSLCRIEGEARGEDGRAAGFQAALPCPDVSEELADVGRHNPACGHCRLLRWADGHCR